MQRIVTEMSDGIEIEYADVSEYDRAIINEVIEIVIDIIEAHVCAMFASDRFKEITEDVAGFIETMSEEISGIQLGCHAGPGSDVGEACLEQVVPKDKVM
jgi:hypothetical protein